MYQCRKPGAVPKGMPTSAMVDWAFGKDHCFIVDRIVDTDKNLVIGETRCSCGWTYTSEYHYKSVFMDTCYFWWMFAHMSKGYSISISDSYGKFKGITVDEYFTNLIYEFEDE